MFRSSSSGSWVPFHSSGRRPHRPAAFFGGEPRRGVDGQSDLFALFEVERLQRREYPVRVPGPDVRDHGGSSCRFVGNLGSQYIPISLWPRSGCGLGGLRWPLDTRRTVTVIPVETGIHPPLRPSCEEQYRCATLPAQDILAPGPPARRDSPPPMTTSGTRPLRPSRRVPARIRRRVRPSPISRPNVPPAR